MNNEFKKPSNAFRAKPFWAWNGALEEDEIKRQVDIMEEMGFGGFFMHSRVGLITDYLGDEWFDITNKCADYAQGKGLESWLYDEDRWPSGSAGGMATIKPENRMKFICAHEGQPEWDRHPIAAFSCRLDGLDIYDIKPLPEGEYASGDALWFDIAEFPCSAGFNGTDYLDTMKKSATEEFLRLTHEQYRKKCGGRIGGNIKGIFTDEPHRGEVMVDMYLTDKHIAAWTPWTDSLFDDFRAQWGYDLREKLPQLFYRENGLHVSQVKWHYCETVQELFLKNFMQPIAQWCKDNHMLFTGHMLHENTLSSQAIMNGSLMRSYELMDCPGVDVLGLNTPNYNIVKQLSSAAHQTGKEWLLSELYGCSGWQASFEDFKRVGDWQALFGINLRCPHLSWYTMLGQRKRDYPASIFFQAGWYQDYRYVEDYFARLAVFSHHGRPLCDTLVINPVESMWCQIRKGWAVWLETCDPDCRRLEDIYRETYLRLMADNVEYDYGDEEMLARLGSVQDGVLRLGEGAYRSVLISGMVTMRATTLRLLQEFEAQGGKVAVLGALPEYVDALPQKVTLGNADYSDILAARVVYMEHPDVYSSLRADEDGNIYVMLLNMNQEQEAAGALYAPRGQYTRYLPESGEIEACAQPESLVLQPGEMRLYRIATRCEEEQSKPVTNDATSTNGVPMCGIEKQNRPASSGNSKYASSISEAQMENSAASSPAANLSFSGDFTYELNEPNVLVIDQVRCEIRSRHSAQAQNTVSTASGKGAADGSRLAEQQGISSTQGLARRIAPGVWEGEVLKVDEQLRDLCGIERRGGNMYQPWYQKRMGIRRYFDIRLTYRFVSEIETDAFLATEYASRGSLQMNGEPARPDGSWWVDPCLKKCPVHVRKGENLVVVDMDFSDDTDIEAIYILGDFGVFAADTDVSDAGKTASADPLNRGQKTGGTVSGVDLGNILPAKAYGQFVIGAKPQKLALGDITGQGFPFYGGRLTYCFNQALSAPAHVKLDGLCGAAAVKINGHMIAWKPYETTVELCSQLRVELLLTRRNTFGPFHEYPALQGAGPRSFITTGERWTDRFMLLPCGLDAGI